MAAIVLNPVDRNGDDVSMNVEGSSAVVTGGASGLGAAMGRRLAQAGARVVLADVDEDKGTALASELGASFVRTDVADEEQMAAAVALASEMAPFRVHINSAGIGYAHRTIDRNGVPADLAVWEHVIRVNLLGTFNGIRLAASAMSANQPDDDGSRGAIVNIASIAAFEGQIGQSAYSASKGGIVGMTLPVARDLAAAGIRVNTIAPGLIDTPIYGEGEASEESKSTLAENVVFPKRLGAADEVASLAMELIGNSYMNGEVVRIDGAARLPPR